MLAEFSYPHTKSRLFRFASGLTTLWAEGDGVTDVLVVEDNQDIADLLATALRLAGHDVRTANDGAEGLLLAAEHAPQVIVLDVGLPKLDGVELARALRQMHGRELRLIAYTGNPRRQAPRASYREAHDAVQ